MNHELCVGTKLFIKNLDLLEVLTSITTVQEYIGSNMDDIPDIPYDQLYLLFETLGKLKWNVTELLGKEAIKCTR